MKRKPSKPKRKPRRIYVPWCDCEYSPLRVFYFTRWEALDRAKNHLEDHGGARVVTFEEVLR